MNLSPAGPPEDPTLVLSGTINIDGLAFDVTAIAVIDKDGDIVTHPNFAQRLNDIYQLGDPQPTYKAFDRSYVVFALSARSVGVAKLAGRT